MIQVREELVDRSTKFRRLSDSTRLANYDLPDKDFAPGTFVLVLIHYAMYLFIPRQWVAPFIQN